MSSDSSGVANVMSQRTPPPLSPKLFDCCVRGYPSLSPLTLGPILVENCDSATSALMPLRPRGRPIDAAAAPRRIRGWRTAGWPPRLPPWRSPGVQIAHRPDRCVDGGGRSTLRPRHDVSGAGELRVGLERPPRPSWGDFRGRRRVHLTSRRGRG